MVIVILLTIITKVFWLKISKFFLQNYVIILMDIRLSILANSFYQNLNLEKDNI